MKLRAFLIAVLVLVSAGLLMAQSHELGVTVGGNFASGNSFFDRKTSFAYGGYYAGRLVHVPLAALYVELPVVAANANGIPGSVASLSRSLHYSSVFVTPGLKLKLAPEFPISPYFATGAGFVRYHTSDVGGDSSLKGVWDIGGGVDWKIAPFVSARAEVRDFRTGSPDLLGLTRGGSQDNIVPQVGLVFRF